MNRSKKCVMKVPVITSIIMILFLIAAGYVFASEPSGSENKTIGEAAEGQSLSTPLEGLAEDVKYDFTNTRESQKNNPARQIAITKQLAGEDITESDRSLEFTFNIRVTGLDPSLTYRVVRPQDNDSTPHTDHRCRHRPGRQPHYRILCTKGSAWPGHSPAHNRTFGTPLLLHYRCSVGIAHHSPLRRERHRLQCCQSPDIYLGTRNGRMAA